MLSVDSRVSQTQFESWFHILLAVWPWGHYLTSVFSIFSPVQLDINSTYLLGITWDPTCEMLEAHSINT